MRNARMRMRIDGPQSAFRNPHSAFFPYTFPMFSFRTAGESHGQALIALVEGLPSNLLVDFEFIDNELQAPPGGLRPGRPDED